MHTAVKENKIIQLSMISLFLAIILVYMLLFQVKGNMIKNTPAIEGKKIQISTNSGDQQILVPLDQQWEEISSATWLTNAASWTTLSTNGTDIPLTTGSNITILSGTNVFYGTIESIEKLGIKYQYALIDDKNIYYINLGNPTYDFTSIARKLGGNLFELTTEQQLAQNQLFGNKIVFINLPEYKEKRVLMVLYIQGQTRLIQMDHALYHKNKSYIKSLFIQ